MRKIGKALGQILAVLVILGAAMWLFGPYEKIDLNASFESRKFGEGVQVYFETVESQFTNITPGTEKRVIWQTGFKEQRTAVSVLYMHGFSATSEEIRPVPDRLANSLGANLVYTRLQGHGLDGTALAAASPSIWMQDVAEGLAAARAVGEKVVVLSTSTGGTLIAAAALDKGLSDKVAAMIFVSPNFGINDPLAFLLTWPAARYWLPWILGGELSFETDNLDKERYWTNQYPWSALPTMATLVKIVANLDFSIAKIPALFWISDDDRVVRQGLSRQIADQWGGSAQVVAVTMGQGNDPSSHVIAGDIMSPGQTDAAVTGMLEWLAKQGIN